MNLRRMPFQPPTDYYNESLVPVDDQICALIAQRKELSNNNPGFPKLERIAAWCEQYHLNENMVRSMFTSLYFEGKFREPVVPTGFVKFVPILKSVVKDGIMFTATHMKQYENASIVYIETEFETEETNIRVGHVQVELSIAPEYECRQDSGCGHQKGMQYSFVVIPPLPDEVTELEFSLTVKPLPHVREMHDISFLGSSVSIK